MRSRTFIAANSSRKRSLLPTITIVIVMVSLLLPSGCGLGKAIKETADDVTTRTLATLDDAIKSLEDASADWQRVLQDTIGKLTEDAQSTIRNEISNTLNRAIASAGSQVLCIHDIVKSRIRQDLIRIKAKFLGGDVEEPEPWLCEVVPVAVDLSLEPTRRQTIEFFGYDFDKLPIQAMLATSTGAADVSTHLSRQTHYHMTLNLSGSGVQLSQNSQKLILTWKEAERSAIPILRPATPVCEVRTPTPVSLGEVTFRPPHVKGDRDFDGNGPNVYVRVNLRNLGTRVEAQVRMTAAETESDWTTASGRATYPLYTPEPGWVVDQIIGPMEDSFSYRDGSQGNDLFGRGPDGPVSRYDFVGDTDGDEAGVKTQVTVHFNRLRVVLRQTRDCVTPMTLRLLELQQRISPLTLRRIQPAMRLVPQELKNLSPRMHQ